MPAAKTENLTVPPTPRRVRLRDFLENTWPEADRTALRQLLAAERVRVNGMEARAEQKLVPGDLVSVALPPRGLRPRITHGAEPRLGILAESDFCIVVDKPAGLASVPDRAGKDRGVYGLLAALRPDDDLRIAHRLDRETSGCLVVACGLEGARWLDRCFRARTVHKTYVALVEGRVARERIEIRRALGPDPRRPGYVTVVADGAKRSREAETVLEVVERFRDHTLVRLLPRTGRGHQLRAHLRSIGHPIVADEAYGAVGPLLLSSIKRGYKVRPGVVETPLVGRLFLHAAAIEIPRPEGGTLAAAARLPADLERGLAKLRRFAAEERP